MAQRRRSGGAAARMMKAARAAAGAIEAGRAEEWDVIADGVRAVAREIASEVEPGALYWRGPMQYVVEQMAPRLAREYNVPVERLDDLRAYLLAAFNEYLVALVSDFDREHFEAWAVAMLAREQGITPST